jgi:hypothetical protein
MSVATTARAALALGAAAVTANGDFIWDRIFWWFGAGMILALLVVWLGSAALRGRHRFRQLEQRIPDRVVGRPDSDGRAPHHGGRLLVSSVSLHQKQ